MLNLSSLSTQSLASCVNYFVWNCLTCFSNTKIGSVTSFSILFNFQGPVAPQPSGRRLDYFTTEAVFCQALFEDFLKFLGEPIDLRTFLSLISEAFLSDVRLMFIYSSTGFLKKQVFFTLFSNYFSVRLFAQFFLPDLTILSCHSSSSLSRITFNILRSRREICTCVVCSSFAVSLWVFPP